MVGHHRVSPPRHGVVSVPIREDRVAGPHRSNVLRAIRIGQEYSTVIAVSVNAVVVAGIVGVGDVDGRINDAGLELVLSEIRVILLNTHGM